MTSQSNPQEFHRGPQMTLSMQLTAEQLAVMKEWHASVPTLYFLDICVVGATKLSDAALERDARKKRLVEHLQNLDRPQHAFSYLLAVLEKISDSRGVATDAELEEQILGDLTALRAFFKNARVYEPDEFVIQFLRELMRQPIELQRSNYLSFLEAINNRFALKDPVAPALRLQKAKEILDEADSLSISRQQPVVALALACLYGNRAAKKLMKFKSTAEKFNAENALADIMAIPRLARFKLEIEYMGRQGGRYLRLDFITDDDGLIGVLDCFEPTAVKHENSSDVSGTQYTFTVKLKRLLTEIGPDEYEELLHLLIAESGVAPEM